MSERQQVRPGTREVEQPRIVRWRGFNLTEMVSSERSRPFLESDFALLGELGFDFVRLPLSYWCWSDPEHCQRADVHYEQFRGHQLDRQMLELLLAH